MAMLQWLQPHQGAVQYRSGKRQLDPALKDRAWR
jgi:hypothetical protein